MIDLDKIRGFVDATNNLADLQRQITANQQGQGPNKAPSTSAPQDPGTAKALANLSSVLSNAATQKVAPDADVTDLQKHAALLTAQANALVAEANALEANLNLAPVPDYIGAEDLFAQIKEILEKLGMDMDELMKKVRQKKEENAMDVKQAPTAMKAGETVGDLSFNTRLTVG